ncbi:MAG: UPF0280 family protein [Alphaproteobacteria bacterium]|nr:UPF0280 family protein [Alphaproteobacteria bacterium]
MSRMRSRWLEDGRRLHLHDGPIDLIIAAEHALLEVSRAFEAAENRFSTILDELCAELPLLRRPFSDLPDGKVARRMWKAVAPHAKQSFITPMAAVAGAVAEEVLQSMTAAAPLDRAFVNNGGDIALHLAPGKNYAVGLVDRPDRPSLFAKVQLCSGDPVRGLATSGWRGRSLSMGIADAVTVLAATASAADAAATLIANAVDLPGHPAISRCAADDVQPGSDLGRRLITRSVGYLQPEEITLALDRGVTRAETMVDRGLIEACALHLAGMTRSVSRVSATQSRRLVAHA